MKKKKSMGRLGSVAGHAVAGNEPADKSRGAPGGHQQGDSNDQLGDHVLRSPKTIAGRRGVFTQISWHGTKTKVKIKFTTKQRKHQRPTQVMSTVA